MKNPSSLTLVTCLFDLGRHEDNPRRQSAEFYLEHGKAVLGLDCDMIVFLEPSLVDAVQKLGVDLSRKKIIPCRLEDMPAYKLRPAIERARRERPLTNPNAIKDTPLYAVFQRAKVQLMRRALDEAPETSHFAWIDFGISKAVPLDNIDLAFERALTLDRVELLATGPLEATKDWQTINHTILAGFVAGNRERIRQFCDLYEQAADHILEEGYAPHDETLYQAVAIANSDVITLRHVPDFTRIFRDCAPLLGLVMIVKNEVHGIEETLNTFKPFIDRWTILDTGSTDGTQELIKKTLDGIPGNLYEEPFVDFSTSRNRALDLHGVSTVFTIMPDSDDKLVNGMILRAFCEAKRSASGPAEYAYMIHLWRGGGSLSYYLPLVMRTGIGWRYKGRVHEFSGAPGAGPATTRVPGAQLTQQPKEQSQEASKARWSRDLTLLRADLLADPKDPRTAFYLGQTYECLARPEDALVAYQHRIELGGWADETFEAKLRKAKVMDALKRPWPDVMQAFLDAHQFDPKRAEPLFYIARHYYERDEHALVCLFAGRASALPMPHTSLFVDAEIYEWKIADLIAISGFYLSNQLGDSAMRAASERAAEKCIRARPHDERMRANRAFYTKSATEMFEGYREQPIAFEVELPYHAMNPSIWWDGKRWRCVVRTVNYTIVNGQYLTPDEQGVLGPVHQPDGTLRPIWTRNVLIELNERLETIQQYKMTEPDLPQRTTYPVHGFEDCRLFSVGDQLYCTSTACDLNDASGNREIVLLTLNDDYSIGEATPLRGPWSGMHQKNWMPLIRDDRMFFIYSTKPEAVFEYRHGEMDLRGTTQLGYGRLRGGSQAVRVPEGWLFLVHDVVWSSGRIYLHRFVLMSDDFEVQKISDPFYFQKRGIEFCAGLGYDGEKLVASFAVNDATAHFGVFNLDSVMAKLRSDYVI